MRLKQNISTVLYLFVSACLLGGALFLGSNYISDNTANVVNAETKSGTDEYAGTDDYIEVCSPNVNEADVESDDETGEPSAETEDNLGMLIDSLYLLFEEEAPYRWERYEEADWSRVRFDMDQTAESETGGTYETSDGIITSLPDAGTKHPDFVEMYPKLAYFYKDLETGKTVSYNADEILYSASLIKAPFIYAVMEEIDNFVRSRLPEEEENEVTASESGDVSVNAGTGDILNETASEEPVAPDMPDETEEAETEDIWHMIEYSSWEKKYDLSEIWTYYPSYMYMEGSGKLIDMPGGVQLTWMELFDYALLYSDNVAFEQIRQRFGNTSFYKKTDELGIQGTQTGFMNLSARDCGIFLEAMYEYFETGSYLAEHMRDTMADSKKLNLIASHYPDGTAAHKYGWDLEAFHDMAIIYDEHPYIIVIMTDYEDGGTVPTEFFADVVDLTKQIHSEIHKNDPVQEETEKNSETESADP